MTITAPEYTTAMIKDTSYMSNRIYITNIAVNNDIKFIST
jgi:hypothetical protein